MGTTHGSRTGGFFEGPGPDLHVMASLGLSAISLVDFSGTVRGRPVTIKYTPEIAGEGAYSPAAYGVTIGVAGTSGARVRLTREDPEPELVTEVGRLAGLASLGAAPPASGPSRSPSPGDGFPFRSDLNAGLLRLVVFVATALALGLVAWPFAVVWGPLPVLPVCVVLLFASWWMLLGLLRASAISRGRRAREQLRAYCALRDELGEAVSDRVQLLLAALSFLELVQSGPPAIPGAAGLLANYYRELVRRGDALLEEGQPGFFAQTLPRDRAVAITVFSLVRARLDGFDAPAEAS